MKKVVGVLNHSYRYICHKLGKLVNNWKPCTHIRIFSQHNSVSNDYNEPFVAAEATPVQSRGLRHVAEEVEPTC